MSDPKLVFAITFTAIALLCATGGVLTWYAIAKALTKELRSEIMAFTIASTFIPALIFVFVGVGNLLLCIWYFTPERFIDGVVPLCCGVIVLVVIWWLFLISRKILR